MEKDRRNGSETMSLTTFIEWGIAELSGKSGVESGDRYLIQPFPDGVLVAVVDGIGHGPEAGSAAEIAIGTLATYAHESPSILVGRCDKALLNTRGAVMTLVSFSQLNDTMTWLAVGNVQGVLLRADLNKKPVIESIMLNGGVAGDRLPPLRSTVVPVRTDDTLILATDGIQSHFTDRLIWRRPPQLIADDILANHHKKTDDALVLVVRYLGKKP